MSCHSFVLHVRRDSPFKDRERINMKFNYDDKLRVGLQEVPGEFSGKKFWFVRLKTDSM